MREAVIISAVRTPIGKFGGCLAPLSAVQMGSSVIAEALRRAKVAPETVDEVIMGNVLQAGLGQNPARQAAIAANLPVEVPSFTINKVCGSGLKAVALAAQSVLAGDAKIVVAGGMESMSNAPYLLEKTRWGARMGDAKMTDEMIRDGLWDIFNDYHMGVTAENVAEKYGITRQMQDAVACESQRKAVAATKEGAFAAEILPVTVKLKKGEAVISVDEGPREGVTMEKLATLRPAFKKDGTVTAGNASSINDGAAACVVMEASEAERMGVEPLARIRGYACGGVDPALMGTGPIPAVRNVLDKTELSLGDIDLIEANEAFAAQFCAVGNTLGFDMDKVNVNGGAIALGHPIGASGARILVTLLHAMKRRGDHRGLATRCIGGGMGIAMVVERT